MTASDDTPTDWRLENLLCTHDLRGAELVFKAYRKGSIAWDHDHCAGCLAKFVEPADSWEGAVVLHEGYTVACAYSLGAEYEWICPGCFGEFRDLMEFVVVSEEAD
jgi:hypothetical protein